MSERKFLILGSMGQLGLELVHYLDNINADYKAFDIDELDILDFNKVRELFSSYKPDIVINSTAYNQVDASEQNSSLAYNVNSFAVKNLAECCLNIKAKFVHFGTDYVFDGTKGQPYNEKDTPNPLNEYGRSKLQGEKFVREIDENALILRLSWVYGKGRQNFIFKFRQWAENNDTLNIVTDEISVPTNTKVIRDLTFKAIDADLTGTYHGVNSGYASRLEWAEAIRSITDLKVALNPAKIEDFNLPAKRPEFSVMDNSLISRELGIKIPHWRDSLRDFLSQ